MSELLDRLKALRGDTAAASDSTDSEAPVSDPKDFGSKDFGPSFAAPITPVGESSLTGPAEQLDGRLVRCDEGVHIERRVRLPPGARHGDELLGTATLHPLLFRHASSVVAGTAAAPERPEPGGVLYIDTETTGLAGGTGTFAFLIGVGLHGEQGFEVRQLFLPGPEHERSQLKAFAALAWGVRAVVSYNGASFDLPLLRNRFALHGMPDPLAGVPHLDLLPLARRLWRESLPDCTLSTIEARVLGARRASTDVPGFEVPARYLAFLRSRDASGLRGVIEHNQADVVALTALRSRVERLIVEPGGAGAQEAHGLGMWLEGLGEPELALTRYMQVARTRRGAAWRASLLLKRLGRLEDASNLWFLLGRQGMSAAWIELAKAQEHRWRDYGAALESVAAAAKCRDCEIAELEKRRERLLRRLGRRKD